MQLFQWMRQMTLSSARLSTRSSNEHPGSSQAFAASGLPAYCRPWTSLKKAQSLLHPLARAWNPEIYVPVAGLVAGQRASEGAFEVVVDGGRSANLRYLPDVRNRKFNLGSGGCCTAVERFYEQGTRTAVAVKKMPKDWRKTHDNMLWNEALALKAACGVPRVVKFFGSAYAPRMECLVLELIQGIPLGKLVPSEPQSTPAMEAQMLQIASQLADTLWDLHCNRNICHLDVSPLNVMIRQDEPDPWDSVRLIDFGFARKFGAGNVKGAVDFTIEDVKPPGTTILYAAPEVLMSLSLRCGGEPDDKSNLMVNGCAADMWSFGCVMYELLTGTKAFLPADIGPSWSHSSMASDSQTTFYDCERVLEDQMQWVLALQAARRQNRLLVSHPIVDRLLQCSARPEAAVHFFTRLFDPSPQQRLTVLAREHPYIADIGRDLEAAARVPANILGKLVHEDFSVDDDDDDDENMSSDDSETSGIDGHASSQLLSSDEVQTSKGLQLDRNGNSLPNDMALVAGVAPCVPVVRHGSTAANRDHATLLCNASIEAGKQHKQTLFGYFSDKLLGWSSSICTAVFQCLWRGLQKLCSQ